MGVLFDMRAFFRWLEEASERELSERHELVLRFSEKTKSESVREESRYLLRKVEEEILASTMK